MLTPNPESEWFGSRRVRPDEKTGLVREVFDSVAGRYDLMNDLMSGGLHRLWKDRLVRMMDPQPGHAILDVAGGTGDVALRCYRRTGGKAKITVCDINPAMLEQGRAKAIDHGILDTPPHPSGLRPSSLSPQRGERGRGEGGIKWTVGDAEELLLPSRSVDIYVIAFGLRNVTRIDKALAEAVRVLKPGGRFFCLEFNPGVRPGLKPLYDRYCDSALPFLGRFVAQDHAAYKYLAESIRKFPTQSALAKRMEQAGLGQVKWLNLTGGIAVIHWGWKV